MQILSGVFERERGGRGTRAKAGGARRCTRGRKLRLISASAATVQLISPLRGFYLGERGYWTRRDKYPLDIMDGVCIYQ